MTRGLGLLFLLLAFAGCSKAPEVSYEPSEEPSAGGVRVVDSGETGSVSGRVLLEGSPPAATPIEMKGNPECSGLHAETLPGEDVLVKDGGLANAFIYIKEGLEGYSFAAPQEPVVIDQVGCLYLPHVAGAMVNQPVQLLNSDPTLHNIHAYVQNSSGWNIGLPFQGMKVTKKFSAPELMVKLKCDVHPWMLAYVGVLSHPYFDVTAEAGEFSLENVPPGSYVLEAWHERFGTQTLSLELAPQEQKHVSLTYVPGGPLL